MHKKINIYAKNKFNEHIYICSTNYSKNCRAAILGFKERNLSYNGVIKNHRFYVKNFPTYFDRIYNITQFYASYK